MNDTKILQAILDGQTQIREDLKKLTNELSLRIDNLQKMLTTRIDKLGLQIANLEDDSPTIDQFDDLEKRVSQLEERPTQRL